jgi:pimeloyl-ACP methyl ester carboxylesterase
VVALDVQTFLCSNNTSLQTHLLSFTRVAMTVWQRLFGVFLCQCVFIVRATFRPVVLMHGLGDSGNSTQMRGLVASIESAYPGIYVVSASVADGNVLSYMTLIGDQVDEFTKVVQSDPRLATGFNLIGISQGGIIARAYIEKHNNPPVHNFLSLCGPQSGVGTCPAAIPPAICTFFELSPYGLVFSWN